MTDKEKMIFEIAKSYLENYLRHDTATQIAFMRQQHDRYGDKDELTVWGSLVLDAIRDVNEFQHLTEYVIS